MASSDNNLCGVCLVIVKPKSVEFPEDYPRCKDCQRAFHNQLSCSGIDDYYELSDANKSLFRCAPCLLSCQTPSKKRKPKGGSDNGSRNRSSSLSSSYRLRSAVRERKDADGSTQSSIRSPGADGLTITQELAAEISQRFADSPDSSDSSVIESPLKKKSKVVEIGADVDVSLSDIGDLSSSFPDPGNPELCRLFMMKALSDLQACLSALDHRVEAQAARYEELKIENSVLKKECTELKARLDQSDYERRLLKDYSRVNNLVIHGAPKVENNEEAKQVVYELATVGKIPLRPEHIETCHQLPSRSGPPKIVCRMVYRDIKTSIISSLRKKKLSSKKLHWPGTDRPVFCTNHLSPETARLLAEAKRRLSARSSNKGPCKHVWANMGRVLTRVHDRGEVFEVRKLADIEQLYSKLLPSPPAENPQPVTKVTHQTDDELRMTQAAGGGAPDPQKSRQIHWKQHAATSQ